jgi:branched-chain amino acid transport system substrate-binding protein
MSQSKDEIPVAVKIVAFLLMLSLIPLGAIVACISEQRAVEKSISFGEKSLLLEYKTTAPEKFQQKQEGIQEIKNKNFQGARNTLRNYLEGSSGKKINDPEARIFFNNADIGAKNEKSYTIAVSVPINKNRDGSLEILRGVAQAQQEINEQQETNEKKNDEFYLRVAIASDDNNPEIARQIAGALVNNRDVLGVVGHYESDTTLAAGKIYTSKKLVAITPVSTSVCLSNDDSFKESNGDSTENPKDICPKQPKAKDSKTDRYIFRTVPSDEDAAKKLAKEVQQKKAAVFYSSGSNYSKSIKQEFKKAVEQSQGKRVQEFDLLSPTFSAASTVKQATADGVQVLMLAADKNTLDRALLVINVNQKQQKPLKLLGGDVLYSPYILENAGDEAVGMVVAVPWHSDGEAKSDFARKSEKLWGGEVSWRTALAYDATMALVAAIKDNPNPTRFTVQKELSSEKTLATGATGEIAFEKSGDRKNPSVKLVEVKIVPSPMKTSGNDYKFGPVPH